MNPSNNGAATATASALPDVRAQAPSLSPLPAPASTVDSSPPAVTTAAVVPSPEVLARDSEPFAASAYGAVVTAYLEFRRKIYREQSPSLKTDPPANPQLARTELALLADNTLRVLPQAVKSAPILGGLLEHLEQVAALHSLNAEKCLMLHNMAMVLLSGVRDGLQAWYVEWALASAHRLSQVEQDSYFFRFPWDACLYKSESDLAAFDHAVRTGDTANIERQIAQIGDRLIAALQDPVWAQGRYAFTGPESDWRKLVFELKTSAALMLAAYLVSDEARALLHPRQVKPAPISVLAPLPAAVSAHLVPQSTE